MKLSVAIASAEAPPSAFVVWRGFEDSIRKAAQLGFHGVELALKDAAEVDPRWLEKTLSRYGLGASCISTGQIFSVHNLYFTHPDSSVRQKTIDTFKELISLAADFGGLVNVGRARGYYDEKQSKAETENLFVESCRTLCDFAAPKDVSIIIEPVNRYEINFINSIAQGSEFIIRVERENIGLMADVFHMNIEDPKIGEAFVDHHTLIKYVHLADSNRWAPGNGHLDFADVFDGLKRAHFDGWTSLEILPEPDPDSAARIGAETILPMIEKFNNGGHDND